MVAMVAGFEISGVQNAGPSSSVVLNGQTFRPGETVAPAQRLRLARIAASELVFTDAEGNEYRRSF
jgi:hypothetical protein